MVKVIGLEFGPKNRTTQLSEGDVLPDHTLHGQMEELIVTDFASAYGRRGGLMVSALDSGSGGPGSSLGWGQEGALRCVLRQFTLKVPLHVHPSPDCSIADRR